MPGIAADATSSDWNNCNAPGWPLAAILVRFQITGPSGVQVRRSDEQDAPFRMLRCDGIENVLSDVLPDQVPQRCVVGQRIVEQHGKDRPLRGDITERNARVEKFQFIVIGRAEKREWRDERSGTDAGHELELRSRACFGPAVQKTGTKGAVVAAARDGEERCRRERPDRALGYGDRLSSMRIGIEDVLFERFDVSESRGK